MYQKPSNSECDTSPHWTTLPKQYFSKKLKFQPMKLTSEATVYTHSSHICYVELRKTRAKSTYIFHDGSSSRFTKKDSIKAVCQLCVTFINVLVTLFNRVIRSIFETIWRNLFLKQRENITFIHTFCKVMNLQSFQTLNLQTFPDSVYT